MFPETKELENAKFFIQGQRTLSTEYMNFASQHDMLDLYSRHNLAYNHYNVVIALIEQEVKSRQPQPPSR